MRYRHYKTGTIYSLVCEAKHSETGEPLVVYRHGKDYWARPKAMFYEEVFPGVKRFEPIDRRVCIIAVCLTGTNYVREVWMSESDLNRLKATRDVSPYLSVPSTGIVPKGEWDYILAFNPEVKLESSRCLDKS